MIAARMKSKTWVVLDSTHFMGVAKHLHSTIDGVFSRRFPSTFFLKLNKILDWLFTLPRKRVVRVAWASL